MWSPLRPEVWTHLKDTRQLMETQSVSGCCPQAPAARKRWGSEKSINTCPETLPPSTDYWPRPEAGERDRGVRTQWRSELSLSCWAGANLKYGCLRSVRKIIHPLRWAGMKPSQSTSLNCSSHGQALQSHKPHLFFFPSINFPTATHVKHHIKNLFIHTLNRAKKNGLFFFCKESYYFYKSKNKNRTINMWKHKSTSHPCSVPSLLWEDLRLLWCMLFLRVMRSSCTTRRHLSWSGTCPLQREALAPSSPFNVRSEAVTRRISTFGKNKNQSIRQKLMLLGLLWAITSEGAHGS